MRYTVEVRAVGEFDDGCVQFDTAARAQGGGLYDTFAYALRVALARIYEQDCGYDYGAAEVVAEEGGFDAEV